MADERFRRIGEKGPENINPVGCHIPSLSGCHREGKADHFAEMSLGRTVAVERGGFGVEGDDVGIHQFIEKRARFALRVDESVVVRHGGDVRQIGGILRTGFFNRCGGSFAEEIFGETVEFEFRADGGEFLLVYAVQSVFVPVRFDRNVGADGREKF